MSEKTNLREEKCCVCLKRLDKKSKVQIRHVSASDVDFMNGNKTLLNINVDLMLDVLNQILKT